MNSSYPEKKLGKEIVTRIGGKLFTLVINIEVWDFVCYPILMSTLYLLITTTFYNRKEFHSTTKKYTVKNSLQTSIFWWLSL